MRRDLRWVAIGAAFVVVVFVRCGLDGAMLYAASYLLALALGIDNVLVMSLMMAGARVPAGDQTTLLRWSFACALGLRVVVLVGAVLLASVFPDVRYAFGAWLVYEAIKSLRTDPFASRGDQKARGLLLSIVLVELAFAADALAALAITDMLFVLVASNLLATAAIRGMSRTLMMWAPRIKPLRTTAILLLALAGARLIVPTQLPVTPFTALAVIACALGTGLVLSIRRA